MYMYTYTYTHIYIYIHILYIIHYIMLYICISAKSHQLCLTLWDPIDGSPSGSRVSGILQARTLEWAANSFSNAWKWKVKVKSLSPVWLFATPWTAAHQAPPSMGFSRQEYWSGVPLPCPVYMYICIYMYICVCMYMYTYTYVTSQFRRHSIITYIIYNIIYNILTYI